jgi:hypothetical protein
MKNISSRQTFRGKSAGEIWTFYPQDGWIINRGFPQAGEVYGEKERCVNGSNILLAKHPCQADHMKKSFPRPSPFQGCRFSLYSAFLSFPCRRKSPGFLCRGMPDFQESALHCVSSGIHHSEQNRSRLLSFLPSSMLNDL